MLFRTNKNKKITHSQLIQLLANIGYRETKAPGGHLLFKHPNSDSVIMLRNARNNELILINVIASVIRTIIESRIITEEQLDNEFNMVYIKKNSKFNE